jgi:hypothetical protein
MLNLISGALIGGTTYSEKYVTCGIEEDDTSTASNNRSNNTNKHSSNDQHRKIPTLQEVARKVARLKKMELDEKQYIEYEMIACTFLLGLVKDGNDSNTTLFTSLQKTMGGESSNKNSRYCEKIGGKRRSRAILLFLTGPIGSGKNNAIRVAKQFCY